MAPEIMCKQNHGVSVDYYAVGIIAYECMLGKVSSFLILRKKSKIYLRLNRDHTTGGEGKKSKKIFWRNKFKFKFLTYRMIGVTNKLQLIL